MTKRPIAFIFSSMDSVNQLAGLLEAVAALLDIEYHDEEKAAQEWAKIFRDFAKGPEDQTSTYWTTPRVD